MVGVLHVPKKTPQGSSLPFKFINLFHEFIAFLSCHFVGLAYEGKDSYCVYIVVPWAISTHVR
jgi:hypothetical protein